MYLSGRAPKASVIPRVRSSLVAVGEIAIARDWPNEQGSTCIRQSTHVMEEVPIAVVTSPWTAAH